MIIDIPCPKCGCQSCDAETQDGIPVTIEICLCHDGSGDYDITITPETGDPIYEKHQGPVQDIETSLNVRFKIDLNSIKHNCN